MPKAEDISDKREPKHAGAGHRARLRERLLTGGAEALADYEVLEYLLYAAMRQGDTKPAAKALLKRFGSLSGVLNADPAALQQVDGIGETSAAALKSVAIAARRMARSEVADKPVLGSWQSLLDYLAIDMAHLTVERVRVLYLDTRNRLIDDHHVGAKKCRRVKSQSFPTGHFGVNRSATVRLIVGPAYYTFPLLKTAPKISWKDINCQET